MDHRLTIKLASLSIWLIIFTVRTELVAQFHTDQKQFMDTIADVTESTGHVYGLHDNQGNSMDALQVIEDDERGYLGVYHTYKDGVFTANLARSPNLLSWRFQTAIGDPRTAMPTIFRASNNGFVTAFEQADERGEIHIHFDYYQSRQDLLRHAPSRSFDAPITLSTTSTRAEGTPLIKSVSLNFSIDSSTIEVDFHYFDERNPAVDRQASGTLTNFRSWKTNKQEGLDNSMEALGVKGNMGDRDRIQLLGANTLIIEGQLEPNKWEMWRLFHWGESGSIRPLKILTHNGSSAFGNPSAELLVSPDGRLSLGVGTFLFGEGAALGESAQLFFYREFGSMNFASAASLNPGHRLTASSTYHDVHHPRNAFDGFKNTRWASADRGRDEWLKIEFGEVQRFDTVKILWEVALAHSYSISTSLDGINWTVVKDVTRNTLSETVDHFGPITAAFIRLDCRKTSADLDLFSLWEFMVFSQEPDMDGNSLPDRWENANKISEASGDADGDGLINVEEYKHGTNPNAQDSDSDGFSDLTELRSSSSPLDPLVSPEILTVHRAIQIEFGTRIGKSYFLETSIDLRSWSPYGGIFEGQGGLSSFSVKTDGREPVYFRLRSLD